MSRFKKLRKLATEMIRDEIGNGDFPESKPPVEPLGPFVPDHAVLQGCLYHDPASQEGAWGSTTASASGHVSASFGLRRWHEDGTFGPMVTINRMYDVRVLRLLDPGMPIPVSLDTEGAIDGIDADALRTALADALAEQPRILRDRVTIKDKLDQLNVGIDAARQAMTGAVADLASDVEREAGDEEFHSWIRLQVMLSTGSIPAEYREQVIRSAGVDPATFDDLDQRCRSSVMNDPARADYYRRAGGPPLA